MTSINKVDSYYYELAQKENPSRDWIRVSCYDSDLIESARKMTYRLSICN